MRARRICWLRLTPGMLALAVTGCGDGRPQRVPISGYVLIDKAPLENAFVKFVPAEGRPAIGETDDQGHFSLSCYEPNDGATLGTHRVAVIAVKEISGAQIMWRAPKKYSHPASSGLEVSVQGPHDDVALHLTWDGGKPFIERDGGGGE